MTVTDAFPLDELTVRVAAELDRLNVVQANGQVSTVPDARTLRYYTTLGLLDRPAEVRGRRSFYGDRHVLQAVAVKALQAQGLALQEIQQKLAGRTDDELAAIVSRPSGVRFWRAPAPTASPTPPRDQARPEARPMAAAATPPLPPSGDPVALRLEAGVVLVIDPAGPAPEHDHQALLRAAAPLMAELGRQGFLRPAPSEQTDQNDQETM
jgi:DNA-binding transcriptional MerR regulator